MRCGDLGGIIFEASGLDLNDIVLATCGDGKSLFDGSGTLPMLAFVESGDEPTYLVLISKV